MPPRTGGALRTATGLGVSGRTSRTAREPSFSRASRLASFGFLGPSTTWSGLGEGLEEVVDQVLGVLDAHRKADEAVVDAQHLACLRGHRGVGHDRRVLD